MQPRQLEATFGERLRLGSLFGRNLPPISIQSCERIAPIWGLPREQQHQRQRSCDQHPPPKVRLPRLSGRGGFSRDWLAPTSSSFPSRWFGSLVKRSQPAATSHVLDTTSNTTP